MTSPLPHDDAPGATRLERAWHAHAAELLRFVQGRVDDPAQAEDLVQEAFLRLHRSPWPEHVRGWLFRVARNLIIDQWRGQPVVVPLSDEPAAAEEAGADEIYQQLSACLPALLQRLPADYRQPLIAADLAGLPHQLIAERHDLSLPGAKSRVQRARRRLRKALEACCVFERDHAGRLTDFRPKGAESCILSPAPASSLVDTNQRTTSIMKKIIIEWRHLDVDGATCERCSDTGGELRRAIESLNRECVARDVWFELLDTPLTAADLDQSNAILIDGRPIEQLLPGTTVGSSDCVSCGSLIGDDASCRTLDQDAASYETVPAALIRDAACRAVSCCNSGCGCS